MPGERKAERLDGDTLSSAEIDSALGDLIRSHRWLFGYRAVLRSLAPRIAAARSRSAAGLPTILDLGAGPGDVGHLLSTHLARRGVRVRLVGVDRKLAHLLAGRRRGYAQLRVVAAIEALPFADDTFDWAMSHLVLHHFDAPSNRRILGTMLRVARRVAVIDLLRSRLARRLVPLALRALGTGEIAYADGVVSIEQAATLTEVRALAAPFRVVELRRRFPVRFSLILERDPGADPRCAPG